ncbi:MAG: hypothetical protein ACE5GN_06060, partial [Waddliaceae bacterium]
VLFYDANGKLCFIDKTAPKKPMELSESRPETIQRETGCSPEQLFTYYDQDHITGTDIAQSDNAVAITTLSEHTKLHELLQGSRRLRGLQLSQRLAFTVQEGSLKKIGDAVSKEFELTPSKKAVDKSKLSIADLIVFANKNTIHEQQEENLLFALQKIENVAQQAVLDASYAAKTEEEERVIWRIAGFLFSRDITVDLWREYAHHKSPIQMERYLISARDAMLEPLESLLGDKYDALQKITGEIINSALEGLKKEIDVNPDFEVSPKVPTNRNKEVSNVQFREQKAERVTEQKQERLQEQERFNENENEVLQKHVVLDEVPSSSEQFVSEDFVVKPDSFPGVAALTEPLKAPQAWVVDEVLKSELDLSLDYGKLFSDNLLATSNFCVTWNNRVDLLSGFKKDAFQALLVRDRSEGKEVWKLLLCTVEEAKSYQKYLQSDETKLPKDRACFLIRLPLKPLIGKSADKTFVGESKLFSEKVKKEPEVLNLILQALLLQGDLTNLRKEEWRKQLQQYLSEMDQPDKFCDFFEKQVLRSLSSSYRNSSVYKTLHQQE